MLFVVRLVANCVRGVSPSCTKGILEQSGANGLKFTLDCTTFFCFLFLFFTRCLKNYAKEECIFAHIVHFNIVGECVHKDVCRSLFIFEQPCFWLDTLFHPNN
jgi:hypothetical protein